MKTKKATKINWIDKYPVNSTCPGWVRTRYDYQRNIWLWRKATDTEIAKAFEKKKPVHKAHGYQLTSFDLEIMAHG